MSKQLLPLKKAKLSATQESIDGKVVYDADAGSTTLKHRYYVFDKNEFNEKIPSDKEQVNVVVQVTQQALCKEQVLNPEAPSPSQVLSSWTVVSIVKLQ